MQPYTPCTLLLTEEKNSTITVIEIINLQPPPLPVFAYFSFIILVPFHPYFPLLFALCQLYQPTRLEAAKHIISKYFSH